MTQQLTLYTEINLTGKPCERCGKGTYQETSIQNDWHGERHCTKCGYGVKTKRQIWND